MDEAQNVSFEFDLLHFSDAEISKTVDIIDQSKLLSQRGPSDPQHGGDPTTRVLLGLPRMAESWEKVIENYLKFIEIVQCYLVYFQIRYLLKNNLHPLATYLKLTFIKRFLKQPLFRFLLLYLVHSKVSRFNIFHKVRHHAPIQSSSRSSIFKYLHKYFRTCFARALGYLTLKTQGAYPGEKLSIDEQLNARFAHIAAFFAKQILADSSAVELQEVSKKSRIFEEQFFLEDVEQKIFRMFSKYTRKPQIVKSINGIHALFCIDYKLKFQERSIDFVEGDFSADFGRLFLGILRSQQIAGFLAGDSPRDAPASGESSVFLRLLLVHRMISISTQLIFPKWNMEQFRAMVLSFLFSILSKEKFFGVIDLLYTSLRSSPFMGLLLDSHVKRFLKSDQESDKSLLLRDQVKRLKFMGICRQLDTLGQCLTRQDLSRQDRDYNSVLLLFCLPQFFRNVNSGDSQQSLPLKKLFKKRLVEHFQSRLTQLFSEHQALEAVRVCSNLIVFQNKFRNQFQGLDVGYEIKQISMFGLTSHLRDVCAQLVQTLAQISFFKVLSFRHRGAFLAFLRKHCTSRESLRRISQTIFGNPSLVHSLQFTNAFLSQLDYLEDPSKQGFMKAQGGANWVISQVLSLQVQRLMVHFQLVLQQNYQIQLAFVDEFTSCLLTHPDFWFDHMFALFRKTVPSAGRELERAFLGEIRGRVVDFNQLLLMSNSNIEGVVLDFKRGHKISQISFARKLGISTRAGSKANQIKLANKFQLTITSLKHFILENHLSRSVIKTVNLGLSIDIEALPFVTAIRQFIDSHLPTSRKIFKPQFFFGDCDINLRFTRGSFRKYFGRMSSVDSDSRVLVDGSLKIEKFAGIVLLLVFSSKSVSFSRLCSLLVGQFKLKCAFLSYLVSQRILRLSVAPTHSSNQLQAESGDILEYLMGLSSQAQSKTAFSIDPRFIEKIALHRLRCLEVGLSGSLIRRVLLPAANQLGGHQLRAALDSRLSPASAEQANLAQPELIQTGLTDKYSSPENKGFLTNLLKSRVVFWLKTRAKGSFEQILSMLESVRPLSFCTRDELTEWAKSVLGKLVEEGYLRRDTQSPAVFMFCDK